MTIIAILKVAAEIILPMALATAVPFLIKLIRTKLSKDHQELIKLAAETAYWGVEKLSRKTETKIDDKLAEGLKELSLALGRKPSKSEVTMAKSFFTELHEKKKKGILLGSLSLADAGFSKTK